MPIPKPTRLELRILEALWEKGPSCVRDIQEAFPERGRPAYTTVQTTIFRMETKGLVRRARKISNAIIFEAVLSRETAQRRLIDDLLDLFGGRTQPVMAHLVESGKLTMEDIDEARKALRKQAKKG